MPKASYQEIAEVSPQSLFKTISEYENYPQFVPGCKETKVNRINAQSAEVDYTVELLGKQVHYTLIHKEEPESFRISWTLKSSTFIKKNNGLWILTPNHSKTQVDYELEVEVNFYVPGFILKKLIESTLPLNVRSFVDYTIKKNKN